MDCPPGFSAPGTIPRVGLWAAYVVIRSEESPAETGKWNAGTGTVEGWSVYATRSADPRQPGRWMSIAGPMLTAAALDSDVALLVGWSGHEQRFEWLFNEASAAGARCPTD